MKGLVYFVGAGPGAEDLITVRGQALLEKADLIIYAGSLVNPGLLKKAKPGCVCLNSAEMTLEQVVEAMLAAEQKHEMTVRLHTGDPSVYGAIREQMDWLDRENIIYEVVPGVSSFCGAAAALKAEYTLPDVSQTVILTRMAGRTPVPERESIQKLASHQSTMVIFLSAGMLDGLQRELLAGGYDPDTSAAIVYKASWPEQKVYRCKLQNLAQTGRENKITKTALVTVGNFLGDEYERSLLYHPEFTTEYRVGKNEN